MIAFPFSIGSRILAMDWLDLTMSTFSTALQGVRWTFFTTINITSYTLHLAAWPIAVLWNVLLFACAPVIHTVR